MLENISQKAVNQKKLSAVKLKDNSNMLLKDVYWVDKLVFTWKGRWDDKSRAKIIQTNNMKTQTYSK